MTMQLQKYFRKSREAEVFWTVLPWANKEMVQHMEFVFRRS